MASPPTYPGRVSVVDVTGVHPGDVIAGKYRVDRVLGEGGMGVVVAAHHLQLDERVAIKLLLPQTLGNPEAVARFTREARASVKIKSEHVARVSDVGSLENGSPYMVMEYLEGQDLSGWLSSRGPLPIEQAVEFMLQACEALAEAHALGIVHRDLKPANLFCIMRPDGLLSVKVLDFGISKAAFGPSGSDMGMTKTTAIMGSPLYMSPEQMESARNVDARGDIWAIGAILHELITGQPPFQADTLPGLVLQIAHSPPRPMRAIRPDTPAALEQVIFRCLEKNRDKRYVNVAELALALLEFGPKRARSSVERISRVIQASGLSASALALPPSGGQPQSGAPAHSGTESTFGQTAPEAAGPRGRGALYAVLGVVALGGVGAAIWFRGVTPNTELTDASATSPTQGASSLPTTPEVRPAEPTPAPTPVVDSPPPPASAQPAPADAKPKPAAPATPRAGTKSPVIASSAPPKLAPSSTPAVPAASATVKKPSGLGGRL